jgi:signal transduction histidine kinase
MPVQLLPSFVSTLAFGIQFLIFVYLYSSHRVPFFRYLLWAWGFFTVSKGLRLLRLVIPPDHGVTGLIQAAGVLAVFCVCSAALLYRWDRHMRRRDAVIAGLIAAALALLGRRAETSLVIRAGISLVLGGALIAAGRAFWPRASARPAYRGDRLLAASLVLWGAHRIGSEFIQAGSGTPVHLAVHAAFISLYFLSTFAIIIMVLDRARSEMRALKELNERLVDGLGEGLQLVDADFSIRHANRWLFNQFGPIAGRRCYEVLTADGQKCPACPMGQREQLDRPSRLEVEAPGGRRLLLSCSTVRQPTGETLLLELVADVTEREQLRARLGEAERLAAVGELAAGVAHEIRNPLAAIVNATTLLKQEEMLTAEERAHTLDAVKREARRLDRILSDFLSFARAREPERRAGDVGEVVELVVALLRQDRDRTTEVDVQVRLDPALPPLSFDAEQLTQVLWNIALNGVEAMDGRGRLSFDVARRNGEVVIAVSDTGCGIAADERRRVFEPFYSKKPGGTGLGLTLAQRIVAAHGGRIDLESDPGAGSRFLVAIPVSKS